jgi:hypothetical protein
MRIELNPAETFINLEKYRGPFCARYAISAEMYNCVPMSRLGQTLPISHVRAESALPSTPDLGETSEHVSFVPHPDTSQLLDHLVGR